MITNPLLVAEVLSPSTETYDRGDKWASYLTIPTLQHYVLLASDKMHCELYTREASGWHFEVWEDADAQIALPALGITLILAELYLLVDFNDQ